MSKKNPLRAEFVNAFLLAGRDLTATARGKAIDLVCSKEYWNDAVGMTVEEARDLAKMVGLPWQACALPKKWAAVVPRGDYVSLQAELNGTVRSMASANPGVAVGMEVFAEVWKTLVNAPKKRTPESILKAAVNAYSKATNGGAGAVNNQALQECVDELLAIADATEGAPGEEAPAPDLHA